ncbi:MAG: class I SAM-dependent methyltransferase [Candidatus Doudnabacteria bacterium]|nr:class I SAM-dependent methyltransferase [Candidatus Doudnabacteria bacterium]
MTEDIQYWDDSAEEWASLIERDRQNHRNFKELLLYKAFDDIFSGGDSMKILVAGCGDGTYAQKLKSLGHSVLGLDGSGRMIEMARGNYPEIDFKQTDLLEKLEFPSNTFDSIVASMVLMSLKTLDTFLAESRRVLKPSGFFFAAVLHPAFNYPTMRLYKTLRDKIFLRQPKGLAWDYFQTGRSMRQEDRTPIKVPYYHRTLSDYSQSLRDAGFVVEQMWEPRELPEGFLKRNPEVEYITRLPRFLLIKAITK